MSSRAFCATVCAAVSTALVPACALGAAAADTAAPVISQITPANNAAGRVSITADIMDASGILSAKVSYAVNPFWGCIWPYYWSAQAAMTAVAGDIYKAVLPETLKNKDRICIKVEAKDASPRQNSGSARYPANPYIVSGVTPPDTAAPIITGVGASGVTFNSADISWTTGEPADTQVEYGLTAAYGTSTPLDTANVLSHSRTLSGLSATTLYHYRARSRDAAGNLAVSGDYTFTTSVAPDTAAPVITGVGASGITFNSADISWTTGEPADTQVEYGLTAAYGMSTALNAAGVTAHSQALSGLSAETPYHYRARSRDAAGNLAVSADYTFATALPSSTILNNGPAAEKADIVFLGDGYTAPEMDAYRSDVQTFMNYLFSQPPFSDYKSFFNVHRVDVVSSQSGTDNPNCNGVRVDTALDTGFSSTGSDCRLLFTSSAGKVADAAAKAPAADAIIIIVNTPVYGGAATYGGYGVFYRGGTDVMAHELGHSFGLLADEYDYGGPQTHSGGEPSEPNVTVNTDRATLKWAQWVQPATPLPTAASVQDTPGLYEGAHYSKLGVYRPTYNSKMRSLGVPFERINYTLLVDRIFDYIPQDSTPPQASLTCGRPAGGKMTVALAASDPESYVMAYRISGSASFADTAWQLASNKASFALDLPSWPAAGEDAPVYAQVRNGYGVNASVSCGQGPVAGAITPDIAMVIPAVVDNRSVTVSIPPNSFSEPVTMTIRTPRSLPPSAAQGNAPRSTGIGMEIALDKPVQPAKYATIEVSYADSEVAGLNKPDLVLARYDEAAGTWLPLESVSYPEMNKVAGRTMHFSLFQVMQANPLGTLSSARISQNPFYPNKGQGKVTFKYLPEGTSVRIYTLLGELVWKGTADAAGTTEWRGRNRSGREVASGLYVAYLETGGSRKIMKLSVLK